MAEILTDIGKWLLAILLVEAVTEIIVASKIMFGFRAGIANLSGFLGELFTCGYCLSVWVSMCGLPYFLPGNITGIMPVDYFIKGIALHRLSNICHGIWKRVNDRPPQEFVISMIKVPDASEKNT